MNESWQNDAGSGESLIVLTYDETLIQTLEAVAPDHAISVITNETELPSQLIGQQAGVALIDTDAVNTPIAQLTQRLRGQFPDLVLVVAGNARDQAELSAQVQRGTVYRFLHKPVSAQRVKAFVDAAWRRHSEEAAAEQAPVVAPKRKSRGQPPPLSEPRMSGGALYFGGAALVASIVLVLWLAFRPDPISEAAPTANAAPEPATDTVLTQLLSQADAALASGALIEPAGQNAVELYRRALDYNPASPAARDGMNRALDQLLTTAELELAAERLDAAARLVTAARRIRSDDARVAFLTAQIARERERALLAKARAEAQSGNVSGALAVLANAEREGRNSRLMTETREQLQQQDLEKRVTALLQRADARVRSNALIAPEQDNAVFFVESAVVLAPDSQRVIRARSNLTQRILTQARTALTNGNNIEADRFVAAATSLGATEEDIEDVRREAQTARMASQAEFMARMSQLFNQRLVQGNLIEPEADSARFYLRQLEQAGADHPSTILARQALSARFLTEARNAVARNDLSAAQVSVIEARRLGVSPIDAAAVEREIAAARVPARKEPDVISATTLERLRYVAPEYPPGALARDRSGWVELEFTVKTDGSVGDVVVVNSSPARIFDEAAIDAVRKWRYRPVQRDGQTVDQRAKLRVRFALE
jgi:TonB family protein